MGEIFGERRKFSIGGRRKKKWVFKVVLKQLTLLLQTRMFGFKFRLYCYKIDESTEPSPYFS